MKNASVIDEYAEILEGVVREQKIRLKRFEKLWVACEKWEKGGMYSHELGDAIREFKKGEPKEFVPEKRRRKG